MPLHEGSFLWVERKPLFSLELLSLSLLSSINKIQPCSCSPRFARSNVPKDKLFVTVFPRETFDYTYFGNNGIYFYQSSGQQFCVWIGSEFSGHQYGDYITTF